MDDMTILMERLERLLENVHQYVGARYVPNFIDEPWSDIRGYEPLDVVDNGTGTSYIAKKPVPVGTPLSDREYWFVYGATSGAIIHLQNQIDELTNKINNVLKGRDIIIITASYGMTPSSSDNFLVYLEAMLDNIYDHIYTSAVSGNSFSNDGYLTQLQTLAADIDNKEFVRDIVVVGHGNDADLQSPDLVDKMSAFRSYARTTFPNAKISLAPVSARSTVTGTFNRYNTYKEMLSTISYHMITIMTDLNHILALDYPTYLGADGWHPSSAGARLIAESIYNVLVNGEFNMITKRTDPSTDKTIGNYMNVNDSTFVDTVTTDIHDMSVCLDFSFEATSGLTISNTPLGTRLMSCNPMIKGLTGDSSYQLRTMTGILSDDTAGTYIPIRIVIHPHSVERPNEYWYYISSNTGTTYTLTLGHNYSIRVADRTPFLYN